MKGITDALITIGFVLVLLSAAAYLIVLVYYNFADPEETQDVQIEVTGVTDAINSTTVTSLHLECIKFCVNRISSFEARKDCYLACSELGKGK